MKHLALLCFFLPVMGWAQTRPIEHRFDMTQNGRSMSANDFDQWLKTRGVRVVGRKELAAPMTFSASVSTAPSLAPSTPVARSQTMDGAQPGDIVGF